MKLRVILTGATGMVGEGVLLECLANPTVERVLVLTRKPTGRTHAKMRELLVPDLANLSAVESQLTGYNACFFCAGVSSVGISKEEYEHITHDMTLAVAETLARLNSDMTFIYVSGSGTDSNSRQHWARVKGRTETELLTLPFYAAYMFRPGFMKATPGQRNILKYYGAIAWLYPLARKLTPQFVSTMQEVGQAMINAADFGYTKPVLEVRDIVALAHSTAAPRD
ncbi:NAD-dependent epimerase/dehydratase family protein [Microvirga sp. STS02]|uniref:NAD-dependent epimerase/dehydratase family protein n=1 Tax=Hymenobacter negativus TaxID=2795026 RepID=UPI0018DBA1E7|nr:MULTISPECIES: NAD-dependent epimerase/dehydratase family protein [Bacteria]MBH8569786.1 NAD-dependent epimerase/dehydratase family protein [Hymenobacter negativus]MBR7209526.1 NAD-dependent epimerase/dehydratase family protein [Microvirga sp. STS02]